MSRTSRRTLLPSSLALLALTLLTGCGGGGGGSRGSTAAPVGSGATAAPTTSSSGAPPATSGVGPAGEHTGTWQGRAWRLFVPPAPPAGASALPLAVCFHGSGDTADNFYATLRAGGWLDAAGRAGAALLVPATKSPFQSFPVWSGNPNNDLPQMRSELGEVLDLIQREIGARWRLDPARLHGLGFSDGGLFLGAVGLERPELATHTITGYGWGAFDITPPARRGPVHLACGDQDQFFPRADQTQAFLRAQGHEVLWQPVAGVGHSFLGISAAIDPAAALAWMLARPQGGPPPTPPASGTGSGGTGGGTGLVQRTVTTRAAGGVPAFTVTYEVYVSTRYQPATPAPLVFAANMGLAPWQQLAEAEGLIAVDLRDHDQNGGWRFDTDPLVLEAVLQDVERAWNVDTKRRYYHGFSAGAHWGYAVVLANANLFAGLGISAGSLGTAIQQGVWPGQVQRRIPVAIRHGTQDQVVPVAAGRQDRDRLAAAGHPVELSEFAGGHTVSAADAQAIWSFLRAQRAP